MVGLSPSVEPLLGCFAVTLFSNFPNLSSLWFSMGKWDPLGLWPKSSLLCSNESYAVRVPRECCSWKGLRHQQVQKSPRRAEGKGPRKGKESHKTSECLPRSFTELLSSTSPLGQGFPDFCISWASKIFSKTLGIMPWSAQLFIQQAMIQKQLPCIICLSLQETGCFSMKGIRQT